MVPSKLREVLKNKGQSVTWLAEQIGIHRTTVHRKLSGELEWTVSEAHRVAIALELTEEEAKSIFFGALSHKVYTPDDEA